MKTSRTKGFLFLFIAVLIYAFPYLFNAITGHGILNPDIQPPKIAIALVYVLPMLSLFLFAYAFVLIFSKPKQLSVGNVINNSGPGREAVFIEGRKTNSALYFLIFEITFFVFLVLIFLLDWRKAGTGIFILAFIPSLASLIGAIGVVLGFINIKKSRPWASIALIVISIFFISGYASIGASNLSRELSGRAKEEREALIEHELRNIESDQNQVDYMEVQDDLDTVMRAWHKKYQEYFSQPKTYPGYLYDGLGDKNKYEVFPRFYGVESIDLACPKCYIEEAGSFQGKRSLYEAYVAILNPLLNKPIQVTLPAYEDFKEVMEQQIKDLLDQKGFYVRGTNSYGVPIVLPEHEQPLSYYMDPFKLFPGVSYGIPTIIHYQGRNINEELKTAASSLD